jgi:hypothetical protein
MKIELKTEEIEILLSALDSHVYWQLSDQKYRNSGFVHEPGSDDEDTAAEIVEAVGLSDRLRKLICD